MDLLINVYGTRIRSRGERIRLVFPKKTKAREYPARRLDKIVILRPSSISTGAVELAIEHGIDIVYLGSFGTPVGRIFPSRPQGLATLRRRQVEASSSSLAFRLAKEFVRGKTTNQITYLRQLDEMENGVTPKMGKMGSATIYDILYLCHGDDSWVNRVVKRFSLEQTFRKVGRPRTNNGG